MGKAYKAPRPSRHLAMRVTRIAVDGYRDLTMTLHGHRPSWDIERLLEEEIAKGPPLHVVTDTEHPHDLTRVYRLECDNRVRYAIVRDQCVITLLTERVVGMNFDSGRWIHATDHSVIVPLPIRPPPQVTVEAEVVFTSDAVLQQMRERELIAGIDIPSSLTHRGAPPLGTRIKVDGVVPRGATPPVTTSSPTPANPDPLPPGTHVTLDGRDVYESPLPLSIAQRAVDVGVAMYKRVRLARQLDATRAEIVRLERDLVTADEEVDKLHAELDAIVTAAVAAGEDA